MCAFQKKYVKGNMDDVSSFAGLEFQCECGHTHKVPIQHIYTGAGSLEKLAVILEEFQGKKVFFIGDSNTMPLGEKRITKLLEEAGCQVEKHVFTYEGNTHQVLDERLIGNLLVKIPQDTDLLLTIGSGTMNDLSRVVSVRCKIPYVIIGTAPSMDGYASATSAILIEGDKISLPLKPPYGIICDTALMHTAPEVMYAAGFTDVLGKYIAIRDWLLAERETGEYFCPYIADLVLNAVKRCTERVDQLFDGNDEVLHAIVDALVLSGIAIAMYGISRPAAGGEHRIAHCWEVDAVLSGDNRFLHGNYVGLGTLVAAKAYEMAEKEFDLPVLKGAPSYSEIEAYLEKVRGYSSMEKLNITKEMFIRSLEHGSDLEPRYNILSYLREKGCFPRYMEQLTEFFYKD